MNKDRKRELEEKIKRKLKGDSKKELEKKYGSLDGVVDMKAFMNYMKLKDHYILNEGLIWTTSDGQEIKLSNWPHRIRKMIEHLPKEEQAVIEEAKTQYFEVNNKLTVYKRNAYGLKQGRNSTRQYDIILERRSAEIIEFFGRMFTTSEVTKIINDEWATPVKKQDVVAFYAKHAPEIEKLITKHRNTHDEVRLGVKKSRMEEMAQLFNAQKEKWRTTQNRDDLKLVLQILEMFRKEAEGDKLTINGKIDLEYEANINHHLNQQIFHTLNLKEVILAKVAARMQVNPMKLVYSLNNSYYKKYSNVLGDFNPDEVGDNSEMIYPSQFNYDFERIRKNQAERDKEIEDAVVVEEIKNENDLHKGLSIMEQLKLKMQEKQNQFTNSKVRVLKATAARD
jgi:predicted transcriptional regulator